MRKTVPFVYIFNASYLHWFFFFFEGILPALLMLYSIVIFINLNSKPMIRLTSNLLRFQCLRSLVFYNSIYLEVSFHLLNFFFFLVCLIFSFSLSYKFGLSNEKFGQSSHRYPWTDVLNLLVGNEIKPF